MKVIFFLICSLVSATLWSQVEDFYAPYQIQEIRIETNTPNWRTVLDSLRIVNGNEMLVANVKINEQSFSQVGIKIQDVPYFTPNRVRNPLQIQLNYKKEQSINGQASIELGLPFRDPSMIRHILATQIVNHYMPTPSANFAKVYINEVFYGLLINTEPTDFFIKRQFGNRAKSVFYAAPNSAKKEECSKMQAASLKNAVELNCLKANFKTNDDKNWSSLYELTQQLSTPNRDLSQLLDVHKTLWMLALNNTLAHLNSYSGIESPNYILVQDDKAIFHPIMGEMHGAFGMHRNTGEGSDLSIVDIMRLDPLLHAYNEEKPLIYYLLKYDDYQKIYTAHIRTILEDFFWNDAIRSMANKLHELIMPHLIEGNYNMEEFKTSLDESNGNLIQIPGLARFAAARASFLRNHPLLGMLPSQVKQIEIENKKNNNQPITNFTFKLTVDRYSTNVVIYYRYNNKQPFTMAYLHDDGVEGDDMEGDDIYSIIIPSKGNKEIEYYFFIENAGMVNYYPSNYLIQRKVTTLQELNH